MVNVRYRPKADLLHYPIKKPTSTVGFHGNLVTALEHPTIIRS